MKVTYSQVKARKKVTVCRGLPTPELKNQEEFLTTKRILVLCTGNSCRSQMAEGFLKRFAPAAEVFSAGTEPAESVHPNAVLVMGEKGIDISHNQPKSVDGYLSQRFDFVITVCDDARETCPVFTGSVTHRLHLGFEDPARVVGSGQFVMGEFRRIRDEIENTFRDFAQKELT